MNRKLIAAAALPLVLATGLAQAGVKPHREPARNAPGTAWAQVVSATPIIERVRHVEPVQVCREEVQAVAPASRTVATVAGGLLGAVIGNQFGSGDGRSAATIAGAVIGGALASNAARREAYDDYGPQPVRVAQRCHVREEVRYAEHVRAWRVTYRYQGRNYVTELPYDPGPRMRVAVEARPL